MMKEPIYSIEESWIKCCECHKKKAFTAFNVMRQSKTGKQAICRRCFKSILLKRRYDTNPKEEKAILKYQEYKCAVCHTDVSKGWHIDHIKGTTIIRGILCHGCNTALGLIRENPDTADSLKKYMKIKTDIREIVHV